MEKMTDEEYRVFMTVGTRTGKLATVCDDGRPHVVPIWFLLDGEDLIFMTSEDSVKGRNIQRDRRVTICVDKEAPYYDFVMFEGEAEIMDPTPEECLDWATRLARRYMGNQLALKYGQRNAVEGEMLVRVKPVKVLARKGVAQ
jgi:hypothetical protein